MSKLLVALFGIVFLAAYAECFFGRGPVPRRLLLCSGRCGLKNRVAPGKCSVLLDYGNITVTKCEFECIKPGREPIGKTEECECRGRTCIPPPPAPPTQTPPKENSQSPNALPSTNAPDATPAVPATAPPP